MSSTVDIHWLKSFVAARVTPQTPRKDKEAFFDRELYQDLETEGQLMSTVFPKTFGGRETPVVELLPLIREIAYGSAGAATTIMASWLGASPLLIYGNEKIKKEVLGREQTKKELFSFGMTEKAVGFDVGNSQMKARRVEHGYILSGQKNWITNSSYAEHISVFANTLDASGNSLGISCFYVPTSIEGFQRGPVFDKVGQRESNTADFSLENVFVPEHHLLGQVGQGLKILHHSLGRSKTLIGAISIGVCNRAQDLAIQHLKSRTNGTKSLMDKASIQQLFARFNTEMRAGWLLACDSASAWDAGSLAIKEASMTKMYCSDVAVRFVTEALELSGASGYSNANELSRLYRDAKLLEIYEGSTQVLELLIAKELFAVKKIKSEVRAPQQAA